MAGQAFQVGPFDMKLVACGLADLPPICLVVQMAIFAHSSVQLGMRRNTLEIRNRPVPHDANSVLNVLLVADVTVDFIVRPLLPGIPRCLHEMARGAEIWVIFDIVVRAITGEGNSASNHHDQG